MVSDAISFNESGKLHATAPNGGSGPTIGRWDLPPATAPVLDAAPAAVVATAFVGAMASLGPSGGAGVQLGPGGAPMAATLLTLPPAHAA